ncbi:MAG: hypothetical protein ACYSPJ_00815 [Planctomycetota bacterium]|jgi:hypothetical protein
MKTATSFGDLIQLTDTDLKVYETTTAITVDGDLSDWSGTWYNTRFTGGYQSANADDITNAEIALRWDQSTPYVVYMALKVTDTEHNFMDNPTTWNQGDFFEFKRTEARLASLAMSIIRRDIPILRRSVWTMQPPKWAM